MSDKNIAYEEFDEVMRKWLDPEAAELVINGELPVWQPIETAPKDGTFILGWSKGERVEVWNWYTAAWASGLDIKGGDEFWNRPCGIPLHPSDDPTHWKPLPSSPEESK